MRIVQSFWTQPGGAYRWPSIRHFLYSQALSLGQAKKVYGAVHLITDTVGAATFQRCGIRYNTVSTEFDTITVDKNWWVYGKILAYAIQREPFIHIDGDVYLWNKFPSSIEQAPLVVQSVETPKNIGGWSRVYDEPAARIAALPWKPSVWPHTADRVAWNMGAFGGTNVDFIHTYAAGVLELLKNPANAEGLAAMTGVDCMVMEQQLLYCYAKEFGIEPKYVDKEDNGGYTHAMSTKHGKHPVTGDDVPARVAARVARDYPRQFQAINALYPPDARSLLQNNTGGIVPYSPQVTAPPTMIIHKWTKALRTAYDPKKTAREYNVALAELADTDSRREQVVQWETQNRYDMNDATSRGKWLVSLRNKINANTGRRIMTDDQAAQVYAPSPPANANPAVWVIGYPGLVGGAGPELLHTIHLWRRHGVDVHLAPVGKPDAAMKDAMDKLGVWTHQFDAAMFKDRVVTAWCNDEFLTQLPFVIAAGRPRAVVWANCMTWTFPNEMIAQDNGWIDYYMFQSEYQRKILTAALGKTGKPVRELGGFHAFYDVDDTVQNVRFEYRDPKDVGYFASGRISRADPAKFSSDCWQTFAAVKGPLPTKTFVLGWNEDNVKARTGAPPDGLDYHWWSPGGQTTSALLGRLHCLIHQVAESRENWPRVVLEAMAAGVPIVAQRTFGTAEMIVDGVSGFLCDTGPQMAAAASLLAHDEPRRKAMIYAAKERLAKIAGDDACWPCWERLLKVDKLSSFAV